MWCNDDVLPALGVRLEDRTDGSFLWKLDDPEVIVHATSDLYKCWYQDVLAVLPCGVLDTPGLVLSEPRGPHRRLFPLEAR